MMLRSEGVFSFWLNGFLHFSTDLFKCNAFTRRLAFHPRKDNELEISIYNKPCRQSLFVFAYICWYNARVLPQSLLYRTDGRSSIKVF